MDAIDPTQFGSWTQVVALGIIVLGGVLAKYIGTLSKDTKTVLTTLTENNSGHSVKDALDRIEERLDTLTARLDAVEAEVAPEAEAEAEE